MDIVKETEKAIKLLKSNSIEQLSKPLWNKTQVKKLLDSPLFVKNVIEEESAKKLRRIFKPFIFDDNKNEKQLYKKIYCKFVSHSKTDNGDRLLFSALTNEMIEADNAFFNTDKHSYSVLDVIYKPYIYLLNIEIIGRTAAPDLKKDEWHIVELRKVPHDTESDIIKLKTGGNNSQNNTFRGYLSFSASPFVYEEVHAEFKGTAKMILPDFDIKFPVVSAKPKDISYQFNKLFNSVQESHLRIYKVGQANAVSGWNKINGAYHEFAFDLGYPLTFNLLFEPNKSFVDKNKSGTWDINSIQSLNPELIMISHWHMDHYLASGTLNHKVFNGSTAATWIAPEYKYSKKNDYCTDRLVAFLIKSKHILFFQKNTHYIVDKYMLCQGTGNDPNSSGLILSLNKVLLTADCDCQFWPDALLNHAQNLQYLTVPHHGSAKLFDEKSADANICKIFIKERLRQKAYICVGYNNWGHPDPDVKEYYQKKKKSESYSGFLNLNRMGSNENNYSLRRQDQKKVFDRSGK